MSKIRKDELQKFFNDISKNDCNDKKQQIKNLKLRLVNIKNRADKLLDKSLDGLINDNLYKSKSKEMMLEEVEIIERITNLNVTNSNFKLRVNNFLELAESLYLSYIVADKQKKAIIAKSLFSNLVASDGKLLLSTTFPYYLLEDTHGILYCGQY